MDEATCVSLLEEHGIKPTANRIVVAKALASSMNPQSLAELERKIVTIDKSNVFRALTLFKEHHLVHAIEGSSDGTKYELCHSHSHEHDDDQHPHFFCEVMLVKTSFSEGSMERNSNIGAFSREMAKEMDFLTSMLP